MTQLSRLILIFYFLIQTITQAAYISVLESGEILPQDKRYQIGFSPQIMTSEPSGLNVAMFLDAAWNDSLQSRFTLGVGELDFYTGASLKYIPYPDVARQPAIGIKASVWHARIESDNLTTLHLAPMVSKKFQTEKHGLWIPYAAIGLSSYELAGKSKSGTQFMIGSEWKAPDLPEYTFTGEVALDVEDSIGHLTVSIAIPFDEKSGF
jgi:hypothetical protein